MSDYTRTTRECTPQELHSPLAAAIARHCAAHDLGDIMSDYLICCETRNEQKKKPGFFARLTGGDSDTIHHTAVIVTPEWFIGARSGEKSGDVALTARRSDLEIKEYAMNHLVPDSGITTSGLMTGWTERGEMFWGLGSEPAAKKLRDVLL